MNRNHSSIRDRITACIKEVLPTTTKTCLWIVKLTVGVSAAMMLLKYFGVLPIIADFLTPLFKYFGLPGEAALAYVSGYFVNVYSALAVMGTLHLSVRQVTILGTMVLCSHSMILETAVLKKTGANGVVMVLIRTLGALALGFVLNHSLPAENIALSDIIATSAEDTSFLPVFLDWVKSTAKLVFMMIAIIYSLNIFQKLLKEFGLMEIISRFLKPVMSFFGLPHKTAFLWIVANLIGLGYGAAAMLDELERGDLSKDDINLIDTHICISHSNLEDLLLVSAIGGIWYVMLLNRWALSFILVWSYRIKKKVFHHSAN